MQWLLFDIYTSDNISLLLTPFRYRTEQIFYFRTYTKYIVTIQYIYTFDTFGICYTAIIRILVLEIIIVYVYILKKATKHTHTHARAHTHTHTYTRTHVHTQTHARTRTRTHTHTHIWYRYTCLAFSKLYSFVTSSIRQNVYRESNTHILSGYMYWSMNKKR